VEGHFSFDYYEFDGDDLKWTGLEVAMMLEDNDDFDENFVLKNVLNGDGDDVQLEHVVLDNVAQFA
jgi:hypothetical protein